jgi:hypothetical protein
MEFLIAGLVGCFVCGLIGRTIGEARGQAAMGLVLGLLFGPIGILITCVLPDERRSRHGPDPYRTYPTYRRPPRSQREADAENFLDHLR